MASWPALPKTPLAATCAVPAGLRYELLAVLSTLSRGVVQPTI